MKENPYNPCMPNGPFYGRELEIREIEKNLQRGSSPYLRGGLAIGKTAVLLRIMKRWNENPAGSTSRLAVWIELREFRLFCSSALELIRSMLAELRKALIEQASKRKSKVTLDSNEDVAKATPSVDALRAFRDELLRFASGSLGIEEIAFLLDETEVLSSLSWRNEFLQALNPLLGPARVAHMSSSLPRLGLVLAGRLRMNEIEGADSSGPSPFGTDVRTIPLEVLPEKDARQLIIEPSAEAGLHLSTEVAEVVFGQTGGHPTLIHELMQALVDDWEDRRTLLSGAEIINLARDLAESVQLFIEYNARLTSVQRKAIHLLWDAQGTEKSDTLQKRFEKTYGGRLTQSDINDLMCTGLCHRAGDQIDLVGEMFRYWWASHWTLERPTDTG